MLAQARGRRAIAATGIVRESDPPVQVQPVAVGELAQPVQVDVVEQHRGGRIDLV